MLKRLFLVLILLGFAGVAASQPALLVLGDSLSAAYGIPLEKGWVALLQDRIRQQGYPHRVVNASISGETTAGGLSRMPAALQKHKPTLVLIELGANDALRGLPLKVMRDNLGRMAQLSRKAGAQVLLFEMRMFANYGPNYADEFHRSFRQVAEQQKAALVPFFLSAIVLEPKNFQQDGLHPTVDVQPQLLDAVWPSLEPLLKATAAAAPKS